MNFLKTFRGKYDLCVNSEKLSKNSLTRGRFYDIIFLGGAKFVPLFSFNFAMQDTKNKKCRRWYGKNKKE